MLLIYVRSSAMSITKVACLNFKMSFNGVTFDFEPIEVILSVPIIEKLGSFVFGNRLVFSLFPRKIRYHKLSLEWIE